MKMLYEDGMRRWHDVDAMSSCDVKHVIELHHAKYGMINQPYAEAESSMVYEDAV